MQVNIGDLETPKAPVKSMGKSKKPIAMNQPPPKVQSYNMVVPHTEARPAANFFHGYMPDELKQNVKNIVVRGLSLPAKQRGVILQHKLTHSEYVQKYLNK